MTIDSTAEERVDELQRASVSNSDSLVDAPLLRSFVAANDKINPIESSLAELFPFKRNYFSVAGCRMHYVDEGVGPVVILLHGNPTWSFYYRNLILGLRETYRVIAPDYIGLGLSDHPENEHFRAADRVSQVRALIDHLQLNKFSLVMHDWGGSIGTGLAVRMPERIEKLIYLNTTLTDTGSLPFIIKRAARPIVGKFLTKTTTHFLKLTTEWGVRRKLPAEVKQAYLYPYPTAASRTAIWDFVADIPFESSHPTYGEMLFLAEGIPNLSSKPTLIIWGLEDPCFHREMLGQLAKHFPQAEVIEVTDASHLVLEDAPHIVIPAVKSFLSEGSLDENHGKPDRHFIKGHAVGAVQHALYSAFASHAQATPQADAVVDVLDLFGDIHYQHTTYESLSTLINKYQRGLNALGLVAGDRVVVLVPPGTEFLALAFAVMARGAVPVLLDPGMGTKNLLACIEEVDPQVFIGSIRAQILRVLRKDIFSRVKFCLTASRFSFLRGRDLSYLKRFSALPLPDAPASDVGMIAFTSGATGLPKGVVFTQQMLGAQLEIFKSTFGISAGKRDLPLLPAFSLFNLACGVASVFAPVNPSSPLSLDPAKIVRIIKDLSIVTSFGSPTLWNKIAEYCIRMREQLPSLERVFIAGAPVNAETMKRVKEVVSSGEVYTPYGATEALPVTLISSSELLTTAQMSSSNGESGVLVGKPVNGIEVKIIAEKSGPIATMAETHELPAGVLGEIIVCGPNVSKSYFRRDIANDIGKIADGHRTWHRIGDVGYRDENNNIFMCGRKSDVVEYQGQRFYSVPIERLFDVHPFIRRSALVKLQTTGEPAIVVEPIPGNWPHSEGLQVQFVSELQAIAAKSPLARAIRHFFFHPSFPVDARHNAKIFRDRLGSWASQKVTARS